MKKFLYPINEIERVISLNKDKEKMKTALLKVTFENNKIREKMWIGFEYCNVKPYYLHHIDVSNASHLGTLTNCVKTKLNVPDVPKTIPQRSGTIN